MDEGVIRQSGNKGIVATLQHDGRELLHSGMGLDMEIAEHRVRAPATKELNGVGIDVPVKESGGARSAKGSGGDGCRDKTRRVT